MQKPRALPAPQDQPQLSYKPLNPTHTQVVIKLITKSNPCLSNPNPSCQLQSSLHSMLTSITGSAIQKQWSFGIFSKGVLIGAFLVIDLLDYENASAVYGREKMQAVFRIGGFDDGLRGMAGGLVRGDFLVCLYGGVNCQTIEMNRQKIGLVYKGIYYYKLAGWKNLIFQTSHPYPYLKLNAQVILDSDQYNKQKQSNIQTVQSINPGTDRKSEQKQLVQSAPKNSQYSNNIKFQSYNQSEFDQTHNHQNQKLNKSGPNINGSNKSYLMGLDLQEFSTGTGIGLVMTRGKL